MSQKDQTILTKIGLIFLLVYSLIIQKPYTGLNLGVDNSTVGDVRSDLTTNQIYNYKSGKMRLAEERPIAKPIIKETKPAPKVASISIAKKPTAEVNQAEKSESEVEVVDVIRAAAVEYKVDAEIMISIAKCESGFRSNAVNGQYAGVFQFHPSTWQSNRRAMGQDDSTNLRFDPKEAARTAAFKMSRDGYGAWPECSKKALIAQSVLN